MLRNRLILVGAIITIALGVGAASARPAAASPGINSVARSASVGDCMTLAKRLGVFIDTADPVFAVQAALRISGCSDSLSGAVCRGTHFWGFLGTPFRSFVSFITRGRYSTCG